MNSTPPRPASTMRLTALQPPPPTPITLIRAPLRVSLSSISRSRSSLRAFWPSKSLMLSPPGTTYPRLEEFLEDASQAAGHPAEGARTHARRFGPAVAVRVEHEPGG